jgi:branched-chain amino acid transport system permease protein
MFVQAVVHGIVQGSVYCLIAVGFAIAFTIMRTTNVAHGEFYMMSALGAYLVMDHVASVWWVGIIAAVVVGSVLGVIFSFLFRSLYGKPVFNSLLLGFGLWIVLQETAFMILGPIAVQIPHQYPGVLEVAGVRITYERLIVVVGALVCMAAVFLFFKFHRIGKAMRAASGNTFGAGCCGIKVTRMQLYAFLGSGALAGLAGGLVGPVFAIDPFIGQPMLMWAMVICIIGGLGSIGGAAITAYLLGVVSSLIQTYIALEWSYPIMFAVFFVMLILRPTGLFGREKSA